MIVQFIRVHCTTVKFIERYFFSTKFLVCPMKYAAVFIDVNQKDPVLIPLDEEVSFTCDLLI